MNNSKPSSFSPPSQSQLLKLGSLFLVYFFIVLLLPRPETVKPEGWRLMGIFAATIVGLIVQPIPGAALVLIAVTLAALVGGLKIGDALGGYADSSVWLVVAAFMISRALINTGLARRIALFFVRSFGGSSLGICYSLGFTDAVLASIIPSNGARSGGVVLPILRSICELYGSRPGPTANLIGSFLMVAVYQCVCISTAMYYTGQASNPIAAKMATDMGFPVTWASWFLAGIVPGLCSLLIVPLVIRSVVSPEVRKTPEAPAFAAKELAAMGPLTVAEKIVALVFVCVCAAWVTSDRTKVDITVAALVGCGALVLAGVIQWNEVVGDAGLWDMFIWYGGLVRLGRALYEAGITQAFAKAVGAAFQDASWILLFAIALGVYYYTHYGLASITAHILAMYQPFVAVLIAKGAPIGLAAMAFATFVNLSAGLTHYGTTPAPMYFAQDYVSLKTWWRVGFIVSLVNLAIWSTVGFLWWRAIGVW